jgi:uncharacterized BrkB/YihY/UPF0761 family membrane protein
VFAVLLVVYGVMPPGEASWRAAWPGALVAFAGTILVRIGTELYFGTIGDTAAVYGAIAGLLAVSISVYLLAIVAVIGANVCAVTAEHEGWAGVDAAIAKEKDEGGEGPGFWADVWGLVRSLFLRRRDG